MLRLRLQLIVGLWRAARLECRSSRGWLGRTTVALSHRTSVPPARPPGPATAAPSALDHRPFKYLAWFSRHRQPGGLASQAMLIDTCCPWHGRRFGVSTIEGLFALRFASPRRLGRPSTVAPLHFPVSRVPAVRLEPPPTCQ
ncbi:hypothetical protein EVG20_g3768 [Dentipellis fragilis]|uniref:Uncharacterized protein n=1 Tax=Dentipellis fragilis TaxID=205917 RepID=A0A4Y9Z1Y4_9AGAM|nr:hypothetical protein EVG20_g3768 [Dentipellis fragilis]